MDFLSLTGPETRITGAASSPDITKAVDVRGYDSLTFMAMLTCVVPAGTPSLQIAIWGGYQIDTTDGWQLMLTDTFSGSNADCGGSLLFSSVSLTAPPPYLAWTASSVSGLAEAGISITVRGNRRGGMLP